MMARENNSMDAEEAERAEELSRKISSIIDSARCYEHHPGDDELLKKLYRAREEVMGLLYILGLIPNLWELSRESEFRLNKVLEIIFELIETDEEEK